MKFIYHNFCGPLAQSVEQIPFKDWVASSNLAGLTINNISKIFLIILLFFSIKGHTETFEYDRNVKFYLPDNEYKKIITLNTKLSEGYTSNENYFIKTLNGEVVSSALFIVSGYLGRENATDYIGHDDVCDIKERIYFKNLIRGNSFNCWRLSVNYPFERETDTFGVIFSNIFGNSRSNMPNKIEQYIKNNNLKYEIGLLSTNAYFSKLNQKRYLVAQYYFNPKFYKNSLDIDKTKLIAKKNSSVVTSYEKKGLESVLKFFNKLQNSHENSIKVKKSQKLKILNSIEDKPVKNNNFVKELKELEKMYNSGSLSKSQFEDAKKKLLK
jgi:hypothetical protein